MEEFMVDPYDEAMVSAALHKCGGLSIQHAQKNDICEDGTFLFFRVIGFPNFYLNFCSLHDTSYPAKAYFPEATQLRDEDAIFSLAVIVLVPPHIKSIAIERYACDDDDVDYCDVIFYKINKMDCYQKCLFLVQVRDIKSYVRMDWDKFNGEDDTMLLRYCEYQSTSHYKLLNGK